MRLLPLLAAPAVLLLSSCYPPGDGKAPPVEELYFPTGLALDFTPPADGSALSDEPVKPRFMYVANSDFDLQYRSASVVSYDLDKLHDILPRNCNVDADCEVLGGTYVCDAPGAGIETDPAYGPSYFCVVHDKPEPCPFGIRDEADLVLNPGRCESINPIKENLVVGAVGIGAFATDVIWRANPNPDAAYPSRLFVPVRGDSTLHWIDIKRVKPDGNPDEHMFECGQNSSEDQTCDPKHRAGDNPDDNSHELTQPPEPYAVDATSDGAFVALTNQTSGSVSLFANGDSNGDWSPDGPKLVDILKGLPLAPVAIAALPEPEFADTTQTQEAGFLVAYRTAAQVDLLRVHSAPTVTGPLGDYTRYTLRVAGSAPINANSLGFDSRGITIDDAQRQQDYEHCRTDSAVTDLATCLRSAHQPAVYVASRAPASLLVGAMTTDLGYRAGTSELPSFTDSVSLTAGASRVILGQVKVPGTKYPADEHGPYDLEQRVFILCFDSRRIFVYDPKRRVIEAIVSTGRGPYPLAIDSARGLAYLGHFTDSYLGVISLDQRFPKSYAAIVASIGTPKAPRSSK
jgi:hypothetical protein